MKCFKHVQEESVGVCKGCSKAVCMECVIDTGRGIACSEMCAQEVSEQNLIIDKSKKIYSIGTSSSLPPTAILMYFFFGLLFSGFSIYLSVTRDQIDWFTGIMGIGFIVMGVISYLRNRQININC